MSNGQTRVAIVDGYPQVLGGAHVVARDLAVAGEADWSITVVLPAAGPASRWLEAQGVTVRVVELPGALLRAGGSWRKHLASLPLAVVRAWWRIGRVLRDMDVVHLHDQRGAVLALVPSWMLRRPVILHLHNPTSVTRLDRVLLKAAVKASTVVVTPSRRGAADWAGDGCASLLELPNCVRIPTLPARGPVTDVITVARLHPDKGLDGLLDAWSRCRSVEPRARLTIVGGVAPGHEVWAEQLSARAASLGIELLGQRHDVPELLHEAGLYIQPSRKEPFGLAALEAQAAGLPVIASAVGGLPDVVLDGETGLLVAPGDPASLSAAIVRLWTDPHAASAMGRAGRRRAEMFAAGPFRARAAAIYAATVGR